MRKKFWIDASAQLRFIAVAVLLVAASILLAYLSMDHGLQEAFSRGGQVFLPASAARAALIEPFLISGAIGLLAAAVVGLLWSHRIIGPLMVLTAGLRRVRDGKLEEDLRVREFDFLAGTIRDFNEMQAALRKAAAKDRELLQEASDKLEKIGEKLRQHPASLKPLAEEIESARKELRKLSASHRIGD